jgi:hypothetical protein
MQISIAVCIFSLLTILVSSYSHGPYQDPVPGDQRPPCPALNTLANHGELPRTGWFSKDGLINAIHKNFRMCPALADLFFQMGYIIPSAQTKGVPFPESYIFSLAHLQTPEGGEHDASLSRLDRVEGNSTLFNLERAKLSLSFSSDGKKITAQDLNKAHLAALKRSDKLNPKRDAKERSGIAARGLGDLSLLYFGLGGGKPIAIDDALTFLSGKFPKDFQPGKDWCVRDTIDLFWHLRGLPGNPPEPVGFLICEGLVNGGGTGIVTTLCTDNYKVNQFEIAAAKEAMKLEQDISHALSSVWDNLKHLGTEIKDEL